MTDGDLLLRAILEDPADDTARLVYADWLEENGEPERAEFVRVQVKLARLPSLFCTGPRGYLNGGNPTAWHQYTKRCRCPVCRLRQREYYTSFRYCVWDWCRGIPAGSVNTYARGFVSALSLTLADFERHAADIFARHPVTAVTLSGVELYHVDRGWTYSLPGGGSLPFDPDPAVWWHPDADSVRRHLSAACVTYGRRRAGLPPLPAAPTAKPPYRGPEGDGMGLIRGGGK